MLTLPEAQPGFESSDVHSALLPAKQGARRHQLRVVGSCRASAAGWGSLTRRAHWLYSTIRSSPSRSRMNLPPSTSNETYSTLGHLLDSPMRLDHAMHG